MESQPNYQHSPWLNKSTSTNQHKVEIPTLSSRGENGRNGPIQAEEKREYIDALIQPKTPTTCASPSRPTTVANSSVIAPSITSKSLLVQASTAKKTTTVPSSATTPTTSKSIPVKQSVGKEGLTLPLQTMANVGTSECRLKSPRSTRTGEVKVSAKNYPKNLHKTTSASQISMSTNSPKNLQKTLSSVVISTDSPKNMQQATLSQIPRAISSPKLRPTSDTSNKEGSKQGTHSLSSKLRLSTDDRAPTVANKKQVASMQQRGIEHSKDKSPQRYKEEEGEQKNKKAGGEDILQDMQVVQNPKGRDFTLQVASKCPISPLDRKQESPRVIPPSTAHLKADTNVMTQERECVTERRKREEQKREEQEKERLREKLKEKREEERREEQEKEEKLKRREKAEKEKEEARTKENEGEGIEKRRMIERERVEKEREKMAACQTSKSFKDAATMTIEDHNLVQTAALQPEVVCVDAAVQAVVGVSSKSTSTSPTLTLHSLSTIDLDPIILGKSTETACMRCKNGLSPDDSSHSDRLSGLSLPTVTSLGAKPKFLGPPPYKSQNSHEPPLQHVCHIEIELLSQSSLSEGMALPQVTVSEVNQTNQSGQVSTESMEKYSKTSPTGSGLEGEPKQKTKEADNADKGPPPEVVWDEQGMTWEVYGAAVDMESLGFTIQSHLQRKIREHEQRIGTLRKSISLSEHSQPYGKGASKKKKRNIFRCFFHRSTCCSKMQPTAEAAH